MHLSTIIAIMAVAVGNVNGMRLEADHRRLSKRQTISYAQCTQLCNDYTSYSAQCTPLASSNISAYSACICSSSIVNSIVTCVNCGVAYSQSQADIDMVEYVVNTYSSACATLGYPISVPITTQPAVTFPCNIGFSTNVVASTPTNAATAPFTLPSLTTPTSTPAATGTGTPTGITIPTNFSIDSGDLSLLSSLLGDLSSTAF